MVKYAIAFPWDEVTLKSFDNHTPNTLEESNENGCIIFEQAGKTEHKVYKNIVLFSLVPLDNSIVAPSRVYGEYYIFDLPKMLATSDYKDFRDFLLFIHPTAQERLYHPAPGFLYNGEKCMATTDHISDDVYKKLSTYYKRYISITKEIETGNYMSANDVEQINDVRNMISVRNVAEKMNVDISESYVPSIDRVINDKLSWPFGDAITFAYVASRKSINDMKRFFAYHFNIAFVIPEEEDYEQELTSRTITEGEGFVSNWFAYIAWDKKITDFIVRVKYCITGIDGGKRYIVDLIGETIASDVEFPTVFTKSAFKQKISHYGPFHYSGTDANINLIHNAVTHTSAPEIFTILGFGFHGELLACENCVYNTEKKIEYERDGAYYFNKEERKGYAVVDALGTNLALTMTGMPCLIRWTETHTTDEYMEYFSQFYRDTTGAFLFMYTLGLIYAGKFRRLTDFKFPYLILNGKFGSGKSAISDMIKRVYNIHDLSKGQTSYGETSPFSFLILCSYRKGLPIFISEFKELNEVNWDAKVSHLVKMYDRQVVTKGTASQKLIYYNLDALGVIDGEELPRRSALKSRSIILTMKADNNALSVGEYKKKMGEEILTHLFNDALERPHYEADYKKYIYEGMEVFGKLFPKATSRLIEWFAWVYAGCRLFDSSESMRESAIFYLSERVGNQYRLEEDTLWNAEMLEIIKKFSRQMAYSDVFYYDRSEKRFCIRIGELESFIHKHHIRLSLWFEALRNYFPRIEEVEDSMGGLIECALFPMWPEYPRQLLFNSDAYSDFKDLTK